MTDQEYAGTARPFKRLSRSKVTPFGTAPGLTTFGGVDR
jgi:hypothetical protein